MKSAFPFLLLSFVLLLTNCGENDIQLPDQVLVGKVEGKDWELKFGNAFIFSSDLKYQIKFLSTQESAQDPCAVPNTGNNHISMIMPLQRGSFSIPLPIVSESARFHYSDGSSAIATSGFLEIFDIDNLRIFGYLQAQLDDDNTVEGSFEVLICN